MEVIPGRIEEFIRVTKKNLIESRKEDGNIRFDFFQENTNSNRFILVEIWESKVSLEQHKKSIHYLNWNESVPKLLINERQKILYNSIAI